MLYYARLKSSTKDYQFEDINLNQCLGEVLEDYAPLLEEKQFVILNKLQSETVYTDRRGLSGLCWDKSLAMPSNIAAIVPC